MVHELLRRLVGGVGLRLLGLLVLVLLLLDLLLVGDLGQMPRAGHITKTDSQAISVADGMPERPSIEAKAGRRSPKKLGLLATKVGRPPS